MLVLKTPTATPEQLRVISGTRLGIEVIRGAAGSGKTSTALLRLNSLTQLFRARRRRMGDSSPVGVLVLTFNRTLAGYIEHLAESQMAGKADVDYQVSTFAAWATANLPPQYILDQPEAEAICSRLSAGIELPRDFRVSEMEYICGRFRPDARDAYLSCERTGRGAKPAVSRKDRREFLAAINAYYAELRSANAFDWHDVTESMLARDSLSYDVVIVDEAQDFSANQIRTIGHHLADDFCLTLVMDTVQRLYPRGFTWTETGLDMRGASYHRLQQNHRNTVEIAEFAAGIIEGMNVDDDGTLPDFTAAVRHGPRPYVIEGRYSQQVEFALREIENNVDLRTETVAFLKPRGGAWFAFLRDRLNRAGIQSVELTRGRGWPRGDENVATSTMHSAKGLEFDHVYILGLSDGNAPAEDDAESDDSQQLRRLVAMAVGRARKTVILGYKPGEASEIVSFLKKGTFELVRL